MDVDKLVKLLNLTTSPVDAEALSAMRMANSLLKKENILWDKVLKQGNAGGYSYEQAVRARREAEQFRNEANEALKKAEDIQRQRAQQAQYEKKKEDPFAGSPYGDSNQTHNADIDEMLRECMEDDRLSNHDFIISLHEQWTTRHSLSPRQVSALRKFWSNIR